jgi:hypothetical protein
MAGAMEGVVVETLAKSIDNQDEGLEANIKRLQDMSKVAADNQGVVIDPDSFSLNSGLFWRDRPLTRALRNIIYSYPVLHARFRDGVGNPVSTISPIWCYTPGEDGYKALPFHLDYIRIYEAPRDRFPMRMFAGCGEIASDLAVTMNIICSFVQGITDPASTSSPYAGITVKADVSICVSFDETMYVQHEERFRAALSDMREWTSGETRAAIPHGRTKRRRTTEGQMDEEDEGEPARGGGGGVVVVSRETLSLNDDFTFRVQDMYGHALLHDMVRVVSGDGCHSYSPEFIRGVWVAIRFINA